MTAANDADNTFVELVRVADPVDADLLALFLDDSELEYQMLDRGSAPIQASMLPRAQRPVTFRVRRSALDHARALLDEYVRLQGATPTPDDTSSPDDESSV
jgi:hypothetical protein